MELAEIMSKNKGIICIGVSYVPPFYYLAGFSFDTQSTCLFLNKSQSIDIQKYPNAIWVTSLPYTLFEIHELYAGELSGQSDLKQIKQMQYLGLKNGMHFWQTCAIQSAVFEEQVNVFGFTKNTVHVLELDLLAIWEYAFIKTSAPFKTRLVLWKRAPYLIAMLGREAVFWQVWYWPIDKIDLSDIQAASFPKPALISFCSEIKIESDVPFEIIGLKTEFEYTLAIALAYRGIRYAL